MSISLVRRQVIQAGLPEVPRGTALTLSATGLDAIPTIKEGVKIKINPVSVERRTVRLTMTPYGDLYPGVSTADLTFEVEMGGIPGNLSGGANRTAGAYVAPMWARLLRMCGMKEISNQGTGVPPTFAAVASAVYPYRIDHVGSQGTANTPLRHGEALTCKTSANAGTTGAGILIGDFYNEDDIMYVLETTVPSGTATRWEGTTSTRQAIAGTTDGAATTLLSVKDAGGPASAADKVVAFTLNSDVNSTESGTIYTYKDGKRLIMRGCQGNAEFRFKHGDIVAAYFEMKGIVNAYDDVALTTLTAINETHNQGPKFLGRDLRVYEIGASPKLYGRDSTGGSAVVVGSLTEMTINLGNDVIVRPNSLEIAGVTHALIKGRKPFMTFNPDEVLNSEFDWVSKYQTGAAMRLKGFMAGSAAAGNGIGASAGPPADDGNSLDFMCPGIVLDSMDDSGRDDIMNWDGRAKLTGGDYDPTAAGEAPGIDNEFVLVHR